MYDAIVLKVLIASPGDVVKERQAIFDIFQQWNSLHAESFSIFLQPVMWEKDTTPELGESPQDIINKQLVNECDILVAAFWTRLGTPTAKAASGTLEEINEFESAKKPVLLYFSTQPVSPESIDSDQYKMVVELKEQMKKKGLFDTYDNLYEFREKLLTHLTRVVRKYTKKDKERVTPLNKKEINKSLITEQLRRLKENFEFNFLQEYKNEPIDIEVGRDLVKSVLDDLVLFKKQFFSLLDREQLRNISKAIKDCNRLIRHQLYLDGGQSYKDFWDNGFRIINSMKQLYVSLKDN